jgi:hypothetical protein
LGNDAKNTSITNPILGLREQFPPNDIHFKFQPSVNDTDLWHMVEKSSTTNKDNTPAPNAIVTISEPSDETILPTVKPNTKKHLFLMYKNSNLMVHVLTYLLLVNIKPFQLQMFLSHLLHFQLVIVLQHYKMKMMQYLMMTNYLNIYHSLQLLLKMYWHHHQHQQLLQ